MIGDCSLRKNIEEEKQCSGILGVQTVEFEASVGYAKGDFP